MLCFLILLMGVLHGGDVREEVLFRWNNRVQKTSGMGDMLCQFGEIKPLMGDALCWSAKQKDLQDLDKKLLRAEAESFLRTGKFIRNKQVYSEWKTMTETVLVQGLPGYINAPIGYVDRPMNAVMAPVVRHYPQASEAIALDAYTLFVTGSYGYSLQAFLEQTRYDLTAYLPAYAKKFKSSLSDQLLPLKPISTTQEPLDAQMLSQSVDQVMSGSRLLRRAIVGLLGKEYLDVRCDDLSTEETEALENFLPAKWTPWRLRSTSEDLIYWQNHNPKIFVGEYFQACVQSMYGVDAG